jgi:hypothetical protein
MFQSLLLLSLLSGAAFSMVVEDLFIPEDCSSFASTSDHLLLEYEASDHEGQIGKSIKAPSQLMHLVVDDSTPIGRAVKGMCINGSRKVVFPCRLCLVSK